MLTVLLGGARSGKSTLAEEFARRTGSTVTYVATCPRIAGDDELAQRIERHRSERPAGWATVEEDIDLAGAIERAGDGCVVVDCLTLWVNNLGHHGFDDPSIIAACRSAIDAAGRRSGPTVVVTNEVGQGIVPADPETRRYRDLLGLVNQLWVAAADRALLLVAGRAITLHDPFILLDRPPSTDPQGAPADDTVRSGPT